MRPLQTEFVIYGHRLSERPGTISDLCREWRVKRLLPKSVRLLRVGDFRTVVTSIRLGFTATVTRHTTRTQSQVLRLRVRRRSSLCPLPSTTYLPTRRDRLFPTESSDSGRSVSMCRPFRLFQTPSWACCPASRGSTVLSPMTAPEEFHSLSRH